MIYFINDTTIKPPQEVRFNTYNESVTYLEGMTKRAYKQTRKERMYMMEELGHGPDDRDSVSFVRAMANAFEMGVIRNDAGKLRQMKCDITTINQFQSEEFGN